MKAVHSAIAIGRQRRRRNEAVRAKARRSSHQSDHLMRSDSGEGSTTSLDAFSSHTTRHQKMIGGVTTLHVGIIFLFMGLILLTSGLVSTYTNRKQPYWEEPQSNTSIWNKNNAQALFAISSVLIVMGSVLIAANRKAAREEDEKFSRYISRKLAPAKLTHHPMSSAFHLHQNKPNESLQDSAELEAEPQHHRTDNEPVPQCQSPGNQLESIIEEAEGSEKASKDQLFWVNDVAPIHHHHSSDHKSHRGEHHSHHSHLSDNQRPHNKHNHHDSSTG